MEKHPLLNFIPDNALPFCIKIIENHSVEIHITKGRSTKYGDFSHSKKGWRYKITVNHNLNKYQFLITYIHEVAHLYTTEKYKNPAPHGKEWKNEYSILLHEAIKEGLFDDKLLPIIYEIIKKPGASSCSEPELQRVLRNYDETPSELVFLESLGYNCPFLFKDKFYFRREKANTRYSILEVPSLKIFKLNGLAEVLPISLEDDLYPKIRHQLDKYESFSMLSSVPIGSTFKFHNQIFKKIEQTNTFPMRLLNVQTLQTYIIDKDLKVEVLS